MEAVLGYSAGTDSLTGHTGASLSERYTLVVGLGATGLAVVRHLTARGRAVLVIDSREHPPEQPALDE